MGDPRGQQETVEIQKTSGARNLLTRLQANSHYFYAGLGLAATEFDLSCRGLIAPKEPGTVLLWSEEQSGLQGLP